MKDYSLINPGLNLKNTLRKVLKSPLLITVLPLNDCLVKFDKNKKPELLVVLDKNKEGNQSTIYLLVDLQEKNHTASKLNLNVTYKFQPLVLDFLGKTENQFIFMNVTKNDKKEEKRAYYSNGAVHDLNDILKNEINEEIGKDPISTPHSSSFVDLNGDCIPDIVLTSYKKGENNRNGTFYIEYWLFVKEKRYELYNFTKIENVADPKDISQLVFADFGTLTLTQHRE